MDTGVDRQGGRSGQGEQLGGDSGLAERLGVRLGNWRPAPADKLDKKLSKYQKNIPSDKLGVPARVYLL